MTRFFDNKSIVNKKRKEKNNKNTPPFLSLPK